ncbi:MAG: type V CRISPR-associated protein Cas12a/Cpf1 [bacterium]
MEEKSINKNVFDKFTNQYALSKTLRFELVPVGNTQKILEDENVFEKDRIIREKYEKTKPYFDRLHRAFIKGSLAGKKIEGLDEYFDVFEKYQKNKKDKNIKKDFDTKIKELRQNLNNHFNTQELFSESVFGLLKEKYGSEEDSFIKDEQENFILNNKGEKVSIFDEWKGFTGYFTKFQETRKNFYKDDGTATAVVTRIVDDNLYRFCENLQLFKSIKNKINFEEVGKTFGVKLEDIFTIESYNQYLLQDGIDIYNTILGGKTLENGEKVKGLNEIINKYRQDHKGEKIAFFKTLDKQILSDKERPDFIESIKDDGELLVKLKEFHNSAEEKTAVLKKLFGEFVENTSAFDLTKIYISKEGMNTILLKWMDSEGKDNFERILFEQNKKEKLIKFDKDTNAYKFLDFIALSYLQIALVEGDFEHKEIWKEKYYRSEENRNAFIDKNSHISLWQQFLQIFAYEFGSLFKHTYQKTNDGKVTVIDEGYDIYKESFEKLIDRDQANFAVTADDKLIIKNFVDNTLWIYQMAKYFAIEKKRKWLGSDYETDANFYEHIKYGFRSIFYADAYKRIVKERMLLQSYLTQKPYSTDKWKLNFENPTLVDGFDKNKEADNSAVILRGDDYYYLAVMKKGNNKIFDDRNKKSFLENIENGKYEKMVYKLLPGASKMLPKVFFSQKNIDYYAPSDRIFEIRNCASHTKNGIPQKGFKKKEFNINDCHEIIDFFKQSISKNDDWKCFNFQFSDTKKYKDTSDFYREVEDQGYKISFEEVSKHYIKNKNNAGELFLFKIHNKDWNLKDGTKKAGSKNVHTLYFEQVFSDENKKSNFPIKLNGEAELFYRPKTDEQKLGYKPDSKGNKVVNHKRYADNKTFFHVPITLNRTALRARYFNQKINEFLVGNPGINIIGVDRGEKHLIYYAGIDQQGNLLKNKEGNTVLGSLNTINGVDYHRKLEERSKIREKARQDWQEIENIKDLKKGYISLVIRKLADLIVEHNAILVFEDLNMRFKQIRGGIEKSVYQQLEKALIDKLNFLVNKEEKDPEQAGHLLRAYQLTAPFTTFKDMGKQTGIMFYTQASYTSKTCPECGFRPNVRWDGADLIKKFEDKKIDIVYTGKHFTISYLLSDFIKDQNPSKRNNILFAGKKKKEEFVLNTQKAMRYKWYRRALHDISLNKGEEKMKSQTETGMIIQYNITDCLKGLFERSGIDYNSNIVEQIKNKREELPKKFYDNLSFYLHLLTNTRSSISGIEVDHINCPHCGFHSDSGFKGAQFNGDANGAYNIARKGILVLKKIKQYKKINSGLEKMNWGDLFIDIEEWDKFTQR